MNNIEEIFEKTKSPAEFTRGYFDYLSKILSQIDEKAVENLIKIILETREKGKSIYFIGNGGSAATCSHIANDIQIGTRTSGKPFRVHCLTDNVPVITAIGNDYGYEHIFIKQLEVVLEEGDTVVAITASGNSPNLISAMTYAKKRNCATLAFTGFDGGKIRELVDFCVHVPSVKGEYGPVEDAHMIFDHVIGNYLMLYCRRFDNK